MTKLIEAKNAVIQFLKENIGGSNIKVIQLEKVNDNWNAKAEVYEDDSFLKAMDYPPKKTRSFYSVQLDENLETIGFERSDEKPEDDAL